MEDPANPASSGEPLWDGGDPDDSSEFSDIYGDLDNLAVRNSETEVNDADIFQELGMITNEQIESLNFKASSEVQENSASVHDILQDGGKEEIQNEQAKNECRFGERTSTDDIGLHSSLPENTHTKKEEKMEATINNSSRANYTRKSGVSVSNKNKTVSEAKSSHMQTSDSASKKSVECKAKSKSKSYVVEHKDKKKRKKIKVEDSHQSTPVVEYKDKKKKKENKTSDDQRSITDEHDIKNKKENKTNDSQQSIPVEHEDKKENQTSDSHESIMITLKSGPVQNKDLQFVLSRVMNKSGRDSENGEENVSVKWKWDISQNPHLPSRNGRSLNLDEPVSEIRSIKNIGKHIISREKTNSSQGNQESGTSGNATEERSKISEVQQEWRTNDGRNDKKPISEPQLVDKASSNIIEKLRTMAGISSRPTAADYMNIGDTFTTNKKPTAPDMNLASTPSTNKKPTAPDAMNSDQSTVKKKKFKIPKISRNEIQDSPLTVPKKEVQDFQSSIPKITEKEPRSDAFSVPEVNGKEAQNNVLTIPEINGKEAQSNASTILKRTKKESQNNQLDLFEDFLVGQNRDELLKEITKLKTQREQLEETLRNSQERCSGLEKDNETLLSNMSSLWKTSMSQIRQKTQELATVKREKEAIIFRRAIRQVPKDELDRVISHIAAYNKEEFRNFIKTIKDGKEETSECLCMKGTPPAKKSGSIGQRVREVTRGTRLSPSSDSEAQTLKRLLGRKGETVTHSEEKLETWSKTRAARPLKSQRCLFLKEDVESKPERTRSVWDRLGRISLDRRKSGCEDKVKGATTEEEDHRKDKREISNVDVSRSEKSWSEKSERKRQSLISRLGRRRTNSSQEENAVVGSELPKDNDPLHVTTNQSKDVVPRTREYEGKIEKKSRKTEGLSDRSVRCGKNVELEDESLKTKMSSNHQVHFTGESGDTPSSSTMKEEDIGVHLPRDAPAPPQVQQSHVTVRFHSDDEDEMLKKTLFGQRMKNRMKNLSKHHTPREQEQNQAFPPVPYIDKNTPKSLPHKQTAEQDTAKPPTTYLPKNTKRTLFVESMSEVHITDSSDESRSKAKLHKDDKQEAKVSLEKDSMRLRRKQSSTCKENNESRSRGVSMEGVEGSKDHLNKPDKEENKTCIKEKELRKNNEGSHEESVKHSVGQIEKAEIENRVESASSEVVKNTKKALVMEDDENQNSENKESDLKDIGNEEINSAILSLAKLRSAFVKQEKQRESKKKKKVKDLFNLFGDESSSDDDDDVISKETSKENEDTEIHRKVSRSQKAPDKPQTEGEVGGYTEEINTVTSGGYLKKEKESRGSHQNRKSQVIENPKKVQEKKKRKSLETDSELDEGTETKSQAVLGRAGDHDSVYEVEHSEKHPKEKSKRIKSERRKQKESRSRNVDQVTNDETRTPLEGKNESKTQLRQQTKISSDEKTLSAKSDEYEINTEKRRNFASSASQVTDEKRKTKLNKDDSKKNLVSDVKNVSIGNEKEQSSYNSEAEDDERIEVNILFSDDEGEENDIDSNKIPVENSRMKLKEQEVKDDTQQQNQEYDEQTEEPESETNQEKTSVCSQNKDCEGRGTDANRNKGKEDHATVQRAEKPSHDGNVAERQDEFRSERENTLTDPCETISIDGSNDQDNDILKSLLDTNYAEDSLFLSEEELLYDEESEDEEEVEESKSVPLDHKIKLENDRAGKNDNQESRVDEKTKLEKHAKSKEQDEKRNRTDDWDRRTHNTEKNTSLLRFGREREQESTTNNMLRGTHGELSDSKTPTSAKSQAKLSSSTHKEEERRNHNRSQSRSSSPEKGSPSKRLSTRIKKLASSSNIAHQGDGVSPLMVREEKCKNRREEKQVSKHSRHDNTQRSKSRGTDTMEESRRNREPRSPRVLISQNRKSPPRLRENTRSSRKRERSESETWERKDWSPKKKSGRNSPKERESGKDKDEAASKRRRVSIKSRLSLPPNSDEENMGKLARRQPSTPENERARRMSSRLKNKSHITDHPVRELSWQEGKPLTSKSPETKLMCSTVPVDSKLLHSILSQSPSKFVEEEDEKEEGELDDEDEERKEGGEEVSAIDKYTKKLEKNKPHGMDSKKMDDCKRQPISSKLHKSNVEDLENHLKVKKQSTIQHVCVDDDTHKGRSCETDKQNFAVSAEHDQPKGVDLHKVITDKTENKKITPNKEHNTTCSTEELSDPVYSHSKERDDSDKQECNQRRRSSLRNKFLVKETIQEEGIRKMIRGSVGSPSKSRKEDQEYRRNCTPVDDNATFYPGDLFQMVQSKYKGHQLPDLSVSSISSRSDDTIDLMVKQHNENFSSDITNASDDSEMSLLKYIADSEDDGCDDDDDDDDGEENRMEDNSMNNLESKEIIHNSLRNNESMTPQVNENKQAVHPNKALVEAEHHVISENSDQISAEISKELRMENEATSPNYNTSDSTLTNRLESVIVPCSPIHVSSRSISKEDSAMHSSVLASHLGNTEENKDSGTNNIRGDMAEQDQLSSSDLGLDYSDDETDEEVEHTENFGENNCANIPVDHVDSDPKKDGNDMAVPAQPDETQTMESEKGDEDSSSSDDSDSDSDCQCSDCNNSSSSTSSNSSSSSDSSSSSSSSSSDSEVDDVAVAGVESIEKSICEDENIGTSFNQTPLPSCSQDQEISESVVGTHGSVSPAKLGCKTPRKSPIKIHQAQLDESSNSMISVSPAKLRCKTPRKTPRKSSNKIYEAELDLSSNSMMPVSPAKLRYKTPRKTPRKSSTKIYESELDLSSNSVMSLKKTPKKSPCKKTPCKKSVYKDVKIRTPKAKGSHHVSTEDKMQDTHLTSPNLSVNFRALFESVDNNNSNVNLDTSQPDLDSSSAQTSFRRWSLIDSGSSVKTHDTSTPQSKSDLSMSNDPKKKKVTPTSDICQTFQLRQKISPLDSSSSINKVYHLKKKISPISLNTSPALSMPFIDTAAVPTKGVTQTFGHGSGRTTQLSCTDSNSVISMVHSNRNVNQVTKRSSSRTPKKVTQEVVTNTPTLEKSFTGIKRRLSPSSMLSNVRNITGKKIRMSSPSVHDGVSPRQSSARTNEANQETFSSQSNPKSTFSSPKSNNVKSSISKDIIVPVKIRRAKRQLNLTLSSSPVQHMSMGGQTPDLRKTAHSGTPHEDITQQGGNTTGPAKQKETGSTGKTLRRSPRKHKPFSRVSL